MGNGPKLLTPLRAQFGDGRLIVALATEACCKPATWWTFCKLLRSELLELEGVRESPGEVVKMQIWIQ